MGRDFPRRDSVLHKLENLKNKLGSNDFGNLGIEDIAYVKTVTVDGEKLHAIHAADGTPLTVIADRAIAFATVSQHDMLPMSVH
jgi:hypothetical protein